MIKKARAEFEAGIVKHTVFNALFDSELPAEEKTVFRLGGEGMALLGAGTETTSWVVSVITFHLLANPEIYTRLASELQGAAKDPRNLPSWSSLEKLPYLSAVILEGLRLSYGVPGRTARIATEEALAYRGSWTPPALEKPVLVDYVISRGAAIGMSPYLMHHNEAVFPDSEAFLPERWLDEKGQRRKGLERYLLSFSKGTRRCLGIK
jgi:cytochrome P450